MNDTNQIERCQKALSNIRGYIDQQGQNPATILSLTADIAVIKGMLMNAERSVSEKRTNGAIGGETGAGFPGQSAKSLK